MNYRHAFHAGNFADVVKHAVLALVIEALKRKDRAFFALDTHAGVGVYDLSGPEATKTGEWRDGIGRLLDQPDPPPQLTPYLSVTERLGSWAYPGSPEVIRALARPQDRIVLAELHPEDHAALKRRYGDDERVSVHHRDAYEALKAMLPPHERRGVVLIDPPFEEKDEFDKVKRGLAEALKRFPTGHYIVWYPIKGPEPVEAFLRDLTAMKPPSLLCAELRTTLTNLHYRLNGCGLALINPPWRLDEDLAMLLPWLANALAPEGGQSLDWIIRPS